MFSTFNMRILLGVYIFLILSIPVGAYLASQNQVFKSKASETSTKAAKASSQPLPTPQSSLSPAQELLSLSESAVETKESSPSSTPQSSSPTIATSFGPTLSLKVSLEGRPSSNQATKLFVGILEGVLSTNPKFLLNFSINLPKDGSYSNLSLAGLSTGGKYTALLKGSAQIATSSAFTMSPNVTNLNGGKVINLLTGDLNEDNVVNSTDYDIVLKANGSTPKSANWNENADLNKDQVINIFDLAIISKNIGQTGASGAWTSPLPKVATKSAELVPDSTSTIGSPSSEGYWIWIPQ